MLSRALIALAKLLASSLPLLHRVAARAIIPEMAPKPAATPTTAVLTMKLLVDTKAQRVVYAEAGKEVIDFLFSGSPCSSYPSPR